MKSKKRYTILRLAALLCFFTLLGACSSDDDSMPAVTPTETGTFTDADGTVYHWVRIDTLEWMVENYRGGTPWYEQSYVSNGFEESFNVSDTEAEDSLIAHNGNYLTWEDAKASAPKGWRLPTDRSVPSGNPRTDTCTSPPESCRWQVPEMRPASGG